MYKKPQTETVKVQEKEVILDKFSIPGSDTMPEPKAPGAPMDRQV